MVGAKESVGLLGFSRMTQFFFLLSTSHNLHLRLVSNGLQGSTSLLAALKTFFGCLFHSRHLLVQDKLRVVLMQKLFLIVSKPKCMKWLVLMRKVQTL